MTTHAIAKLAPQPLHDAMHAASVKMILGAVIALVGKNGDPQTGWIGGRSLRTDRVQFSS